MSAPLRALPGPPPEDDPITSFESMEQEISQMSAGPEVGAPVLPCKKPFLEVWLLDDDLSPVSGPCHVKLPTGKSRDGVLDEAGYVKFDDFLVDEPDVLDTMGIGSIDPEGNAELWLQGEGEVEDEADDEPEDEVASPDLYDEPGFEDW